MIRIQPIEWNNYICMRFDLIGCEDTCLHQLGMEDKRIDNGQITASSVWNSALGQDFSPQNARLNHQETSVIGGAWAAGNINVDQWIQVNLRAIMWVSGVMIQGRNSLTHIMWVTKFKVAYNIYGSEWKHVKMADNQEELVFDGNIDRDTIVTNLFPSPVQATMIKIQPNEWYTVISMRFDLLGCKDPEWQLVFKAVSGVASAPMNSDGFDEHDPYKVWERNEPTNEEIPEARQLNRNFTGHYKSSFAVDWETRNIDKVMVVLLDYTGVELMTLLFNGTGSNSLDWFSKERLLSSPYDDIDSEPQNYFSVEGDKTPNFERRWFINRNYGGCDVENGWMVVAYDFTPDCDWERKNMLPAFLYSLKTTYINWNNDTAPECYSDPIGRDYRGSVNQTIDGMECQSWTAQYPHEHTNTPENLPDTGLGEHNYCRNPDEAGNWPWCYTKYPETRWAYCRICVCDTARECYSDPLGRDYRGSVNQTIQGKECQSWTAQYPHEHTRTPANYPDTGLGEHNYCRNPDHSIGPWCYTTDPETRWAYCRICVCNTDVGQASIFAIFAHTPGDN
ncbi:uncharacterized protein [Amphiura filiformis]|uniref:uncharacterized protein n=1 Tax=Amphiura filiformis TaxID=82378 RepID=UPI003B224995